MFRHLQEEPRWNADRRACSAEHAAASLRCGGKDTRLSAFRFPVLSVPSSFRSKFFHVVAGSSEAKPGSDIETFRPFPDFTWLNPGDRSLAHAPRVRFY